MRARHLILLAAAVVAAGAFAQTSTFTGSYTATAPGGSFSLTLQQDVSGRITGTLVGGGLNVQVEGAGSGAVAEGTLASSMGKSFFHAELAGGQLTLTVVDPDIYGQPDFSTAQQFVFSRSQTPTPGRGAASSEVAPPPARLEPAASASGPPKLAGGEIGDASWGFHFKAPEGWRHQKTAEGVLMGSDTEKGLILVMPHLYNSLSELEAAARQGIVEQGTQLALAAAVEPFGDRGLAAQYQGVADGQRARAFAIGLLSPHGGGATILTAVEEASYSNAYADRVEAIARSLRFSKPEAGPVVAQWRQKLAGHCVAYLSSYSSSGGSYGGYSTGGYSSSKARLYLYPDGRFEGSSSSSVSIDTGGAFGSSAGGSGPQTGRWQVKAAAGGVVLQVQHPDGSTTQYGLSSNEKGHTLLDGERWYVVSYQECNDL